MSLCHCHRQGRICSIFTGGETKSEISKSLQGIDLWPGIRPGPAFSQTLCFSPPCPVPPPEGAWSTVGGTLGTGWLFLNPVRRERGQGRGTRSSAPGRTRQAPQKMVCWGPACPAWHGVSSQLLFLGRARWRCFPAAVQPPVLMSRNNSGCVGGGSPLSRLSLLLSGPDP